MPNAVGDETFINWFPKLCSTKSAPSEAIKPTKSLHFAHKLGEGFHLCLLLNVCQTQQVCQQREKNTLYNKKPKITLMLAEESNLG